jgi:hypothetical protein
VKLAGMQVLTNKLDRGYDHCTFNGKLPGAVKILK